MGDAEDAFKLKLLGQDQTGTVTLRSFDRGVIETLRATVVDSEYIIAIPNVNGPPGKSGVPVVFSHPEDIFQTKRLPCVVVQRDSMSPAMGRWHGPVHEQYKTAAVGALLKSVTKVDGTVKQGFDKIETLKQAMPFDLGYTVSIYSTGRDAADRLHVSKILDYVLKVYQPYCYVFVKDSLEDPRSYQAYMEGVSMLDEIADVTERYIGFALTLRVEAELDLEEPQVTAAVTSVPKINKILIK